MTTAHGGIAAAGSGTTIVMCRPSIGCERLVAEMTGRGMRVEVRCLDWGFQPPSDRPTLAVFLIGGHAYGAQAGLRRRVDEVRASNPAMPVVALVQDSRVDLRHLADAGLSNFLVGLPWDGTTAEFLSRMAVRAGRIGAMAPMSKPAPLPERVVFTAREMQTLERLRSGLQNKTIAGDLGVSLRTVKAYVRNVLAKLQVSSRSEAIALLAKYDLPSDTGTFPRIFPADVKPAPPPPLRRRMA